ncbi:MAG: hypothetical protein U0670_18885 [Anaerolineae bacterium]
MRCSVRSAGRWPSRSDAKGRWSPSLCTAADFSLLGIGAPFWGLVLGLAVHWIMTAQRQAAAR